MELIPKKNIKIKNLFLLNNNLNNKYNKLDDETLEGNYTKPDNVISMR